MLAYVVNFGKKEFFIDNCEIKCIGGGRLNHDEEKKLI